MPELRVNRVLRHIGQGIQRSLRKGNIIRIDESSFQMVHVPGRIFVIMKKEVTVGQFKQFVESSRYKINGHNSEMLKKVLLDPSQIHNTINFVNLHDAKAYAEWLSEQTGKKYRVPSSDDLLIAMSHLKDVLSGESNEWTTTKLINGDCVLHSLYLEKKIEKLKQYQPSVMGKPISYFSGERYINTAIRLIKIIESN